MTGTGGRWFIAVAALAFLGPLAGCSGGDDDDAVAPSSAPSPSAVETAPSGSASSMTTAATTAPPMTTSPATSLPVTAAVPVTVSVDEATKTAVAAAAVSAREAYNYAVLNYDAADALDVLAASYLRDGPAWNQTLGNMNTLRANGWLARANPAVADSSTVEGQVQLIVANPPTRAQVMVCTVSAGEVFKPAGAPDGGDLIINDELVARRELLTFVVEADTWKLEQGTILATWKGQAECPAA